MTQHLAAAPAAIVNADVVDILREALQRAERGEINGLFLLELGGAKADYYTAGIKDRWRALGVIQHAAYLLHGA